MIPNEWFKSKAPSLRFYANPIQTLDPVGVAHPARELVKLEDADANPNQRACPMTTGGHTMRSW